MKKIKNPYNPEVNRCFACSTSNPIGLRLTFEEEGKYLLATWSPTEFYQGYVNILHGGIIATLLDEIGAWCLNVKRGTAGVTSKLCISYHKPVFMSKGDVSLKAEITGVHEKQTDIHCYLYDSSGNLCAEAESEFFTYPEEVAKRKFGFPGKESFYFD